MFNLSAILEALPQLELQLAPQNDARRNIILTLPVQIEADSLPRTLLMLFVVSGAILE